LFENQVPVAADRRSERLQILLPERSHPVALAMDVGTEVGCDHGEPRVETPLARESWHRLPRAGEHLAVQPLAVVQAKVLKCLPVTSLVVLY
jgi:hypothetical protein